MAVLGEGAVGRWRPRHSELTVDCQAFRGTLATRVLVCRPRDPEAKGLVERLHDYLERSFLPGRVFASPAEFNVDLAAFLDRANSRHHRRLGCRPADRIDADRAAMLALPPVPPVTGWRSSLRLPRDHYVRLDSNDYSVHPAVIGRRVEVVADLDRVRVFCQGRLAADHPRVWARHQTVSDPAHVAAAKTLRRERLELVRPPAQPHVQVRCLADYDTALGIDGGGWRDGAGDQDHRPGPDRGGGVPDPGVHRWLGWYRDDGLEGLAGRSSRPRTCPVQTPPEVETAICELRRTRPRWGARRIEFEVGRNGCPGRIPSRITIHRS